MNYKLSITSALVILTLALATATARAQTTANGPYYAPPSWDQTLPSATRFIVLSNMGSNAVLDRETGLVWQKSPDSTARTWFGAQQHCGLLSVGNRKGWRLPTVQELASLVDDDPANTSSPRLPPGHPFQGVQSSTYWSATSSAGIDGFAWALSFSSGDVFSAGGKGQSVFVWCVRGGQGVDPQ